MRTLAALLLIGTAAFAQSANGTNCSVDGFVVNSVSGSPVPRAQVSVVGADDTWLAESDAAGKWSVGHAACGRVTITVNRTGFLRLQQSNLPLIANTPLSGLKLRLAPQAVLAGRVLDDQGDPIQGAQVSLMTARIIDGLRGIQASSSTPTNDLGEYRFSGLTAGKYLVCANAGGGAVAANAARPYGEKCYPGPMDGGVSSAMDVAAGYEGRIDFALAPLVTVQVGGVVSGKPDDSGCYVNLIPRTQIARMAMALSAQVRPDGTFLIRHVPPGSYTLSAMSADRQNKRLTARMPLVVAGNDIEGIQVHLDPGVPLAGTIGVLSGTNRKIAGVQSMATLISQDWGIAGGAGTVWDENKTSFTIPDVVPGSYRLNGSPPAPFYLKSATLGGRDIAGSEFAIGPGAGSLEIVLSDDGGVVEGDVSADDGPAAAWIFLEKDGAPSRNARTDTNGHFKIETVPPGDYKAYAWDDNTRVEYANPEWMRRNGKGVAVTVDPGQTARVKLVRQVAPPD